MSQESKTPITIKIPTSLYNALVKAVSKGKYPSQTAGVIIALDHDLDECAITNEELQKTIQRQSSMLDEKDKTIQKLALDFSTSQATCAGLERLLNEKDTRITDLQKQNEQLGVKDNQIGKLSETLQAQAIHIQTLINQKAIEAPGAKKPWYKFW